MNISDRLDSFAQPWKPKPGDKLIGTVVDVDIRDSDYGEPYPIVTIVDGDGSEHAFHGFHTVARRELAKKQPQVGDRIGVAYFGKSEPSKPGMSGAELYKIVVDRDEKPTAVDWTAVGALADADAVDEGIDDAPSANAAPADDGIPF